MLYNLCYHLEGKERKPDLFFPASVQWSSSIYQGTPNLHEWWWGNWVSDYP